MLRFLPLSVCLAVASSLFALSGPTHAQPMVSTPEPPLLSASQSDGLIPTSSPKQSAGVARGAGDADGVTITLNTPQVMLGYQTNTYVQVGGQQTFGGAVQIYNGDGQNDNNEYLGGAVYFATHAGVTINDTQISGSNINVPNYSGNLGGYVQCPRLLAPNHIYYFKAFGKNYGGAVVATSNEVSVDMTDHAPSTVTLSAATGDDWSGGQKVNVSWTQTTDPDSNSEADYTLCEADHPGVTLDDNVLSANFPRMVTTAGPRPTARTSTMLQATRLRAKSTITACSCATPTTSSPRTKSKFRFCKKRPTSK